jgi:hypothetical protein
MCRSAVRDGVHHLFAFGWGLAYGILSAITRTYRASLLVMCLWRDCRPSAALVDCGFSCPGVGKDVRLRDAHGVENRSVVVVEDAHSRAWPSPHVCR